MSVSTPATERRKPTEEARHFDPCANGDCGLIATSRFDTTTHGKQAGDAYTLPERHALDISVVECSVDNGCNTVSGNDQNESAPRSRARLELPGRERDVTLAFTSPS